MSHDARCERSGTDPKRCRCNCGGAHHGEQASQIDLEYAGQRRDGYGLNPPPPGNATAFGMSRGVPR